MNFEEVCLFGCNMELDHLGINQVECNSFHWKSLTVENPQVAHMGVETINLGINYD